MPLHKLAEGPITMTIGAIEPTEGSFGPQIKFISTDGVDVYINELPATQQIARMGLTLDTVVGQTLYFEHVKKNGRTFTNITRAGGASAAPAAGQSAAPTAPRVAAPAPAPKLSIPELTALYSECVSGAMATLGAKCEESGIPIDASAIQAAAATLLIQHLGRK